MEMSSCRSRPNDLGLSGVGRQDAQPVAAFES
jgi:hypothetical protein